MDLQPTRTNCSLGGNHPGSFPALVRVVRSPGEVQISFWWLGKYMRGTPQCTSSLRDALRRVSSVVPLFCTDRKGDPQNMPACQFSPCHMKKLRRAEEPFPYRGALLLFVFLDSPTCRGKSGQPPCKNMKASSRGTCMYWCVVSCPRLMLDLFPSLWGTLPEWHENDSTNFSSTGVPRSTVCETRGETRFFT